MYMYNQFLHISSGCLRYCLWGSSSWDSWRAVGKAYCRSCDLSNFCFSFLKFLLLSLCVCLFADCWTEPEQRPTCNEILSRLLTASTRFANFSQNLVFLSVNRNFAARRGFRFSSLSLYKRTFGRFHIRNKLCGTLFCFVIAPLVTSKPFEKKNKSILFSLLGFSTKWSTNFQFFLVFILDHVKLAMSYYMT